MYVNVRGHCFLLFIRSGKNISALRRESECTVRSQFIHMLENCVHACYCHKSRHQKTEQKRLIRNSIRTQKNNQLTAGEPRRVKSKLAHTQTPHFENSNIVQLLTDVGAFYYIRARVTCHPTTPKYIGNR